MATKAPSRTQRWQDAAATALEAVDRAKTARDEAIDALADLRDVQAEYQEWLDNLPESLQSSAVGEKLTAVCDLDLEPDERDLDAIEDAAGEAEGADLPLGFGRD